MKKTQTYIDRRLIDKKELRKLVLYSDSQIARLENQGEFPKRLRLGQRRVAWVLSDVMGWVEQRAKAAKSRQLSNLNNE
jgi:prophage regulatory protein